MFEGLTGIRPDHLANCGTTRVLQENIPLKAADVYLEPNRRGERVLSGKPSFRLTTPRGIMLPNGAVPRIPILGLRALVASDLRVIIDGKRQSVSIHSGWW